jgi:hypothetical protein
MSDFSVNGLGGPKFGAASRPASAPAGSNPSLLSQNGPVDSFQFSNPLGATSQPLVIGGVPVKLDASTLHGSTLSTLKNPPEHHSLFPPFTDITG